MRWLSLATILLLVASACGSRQGDALARKSSTPTSSAEPTASGSVSPSAAPMASPAPSASPTASPSPSAPPSASASASDAPSAAPGIEHVEAYALGELHGDYVFAAATGYTGTSTAAFYEHPTFEIWAMPLNGGPAQLALRYHENRANASNTTELRRQFSPDRRRFVFSTMFGGCLCFQLAIADLVSGTVRPLLRAEREGYITPAWSPNGEWIAFVKSVYVKSGAGGEIWLVHPDGTGLRKVGEGNGIFAWSPDSARLHYATLRNSFPYTHQVLELATENVTTYADRSLPYEFTVQDIRAGTPRFVGAFVSIDYATEFLRVGDDPPSARTVAEFHPTLKGRLSGPAWRPGKDEILFVNEYRAFTMSASGGSPAAVALRDPAGWAVWSPSGDRIVYISYLLEPDHRYPIAVRVADPSGGRDRALFEPPRDKLSLDDLITVAYP